MKDTSTFVESIIISKYPSLVGAITPFLTLGLFSNTGIIVPKIQKSGYIMLSNCRDAMDNSPIIAAIKDMTGLEKCLTCDSQVIFILFGDICNISDIVDKVKSAGKTAMVHID